MRSPYRIIRNVPVLLTRGGDLVLTPERDDGKGAELDVVPLEDVEILRRKAIAWDYAVRRGFLPSSKITAATEFSRLDVETATVAPGEVVLFRTPDLGGEGLRDLGSQLAELFPDNRVVLLPGDTGGFEALSEEDARELPSVARALDELAERRAPARKPRET